MQLGELEQLQESFQFKLQDELNLQFSGIKLKLKLNIPRTAMGGYYNYHPIFTSETSHFIPDLTLEVNYQHLTLQQHELCSKLELPQEDLLCRVRRVWDLGTYQSDAHGHSKYIFIFKRADKPRKRLLLEGKKKRVFKTFRNEFKFTDFDTLPCFLDAPVKLAVFNQDFRYGKLLLETRNNAYPDPFEYPLGMFFTIFYFSLRDNAVLMHCSAVEDRGKSYLFLGPSGAGKSTLAKLWLATGSGKVLHEEKALVRLKPKGIFVSALPFFPNNWITSKTYIPAATSREYPLAKVFYLRHGARNAVRRPRAKEALRILLQQSLLPLWDKALIPKVYRLYLDLLQSAAFRVLSFKPDTSVIDFIKKL